MADSCPNCAREIGLEDRLCTYCHSDARPPNVRFAMRAGEAKALAANERKAVNAAKKKGVLKEIDALRQRAGDSKLVINRKFRALEAWLASENELYVNFYKLKELGVKMIDDQFNRQRISAENTISPGFFRQLVVGALTIDGEGMSYYGDWTVIIRDDAIRARASVFWDNPFTFNKEKKIISGEDPPEGYRAPWEARADLAVAKLGGQLGTDGNGAPLESLFMGPDRTHADCRFIEVHIHGDIHADAIESVTPPKRMSPTDRTEWKVLRAVLSSKGCVC